MASSGRPAGPRRFLDWALAVIVAAGLVIDAVVHLHLASRYGPVGGTLNQGLLFRLQASVAALAALLVLVVPQRRAAYCLAFIAATAALGAVMLYRYVDVGSLGPLPDMYEPAWYGQKSLSAVAEATAAVTALAGLAMSANRHRRDRHPHGVHAADGSLASPTTGSTRQL